jgi:hypothetical protein
MRGRDRNPAGGSRPRWPARSSRGGGGPEVARRRGATEAVRIDLAELRVVSVCFEEGRRRRYDAAVLPWPAAPVAARLLGTGVGRRDGALGHARARACN